MLATGLRWVIRLYQLMLRPVLGLNCRYLPTCSDYAIEALSRHGAIRGAGLAAHRLLRCNPWCAGGHDPVPPNRPTHPIQKSPAAY